VDVPREEIVLVVFELVIVFSVFVVWGGRHHKRLRFIGNNGIGELLLKER
jgi:hypothetical protein